MISRSGNLSSVSCIERIEDRRGKHTKTEHRMAFDNCHIHSNSQKLFYQNDLPTLDKTEIKN